jgi:cytosine/adenosine deaminase-related metal-dependent hydrolase
MDEEQAESFKAIAWCPASNFFLFGKTAAIDRLIKRTTIVFGTDSTLTAPWNFWEHLRQARNTQLVSDEALFDMLNMVPAKTWGLPGTGILEEGKYADIVVAGNNASSQDREKFFDLNPADILLVFCHGQLRVCDASFYDKVRQMDVSLENFSKVMVDGTEKYVYGDLVGLIDQVRALYPGAQLPVTNCS